MTTLRSTAGLRRRLISIVTLLTILITVADPGVAASANAEALIDPLDVDRRSMTLETVPLLAREGDSYAADLPPFVLIALSWEGPAETVAIRTSFQGQSADWHNLSVDDHAADGDSHARHYTAPLWVRAADRVELVTERFTRNLKAHIVLPNGERTPTLLRQAASPTPSDGRPTIIPRSSWLPRPTEDPHDAAKRGEFVVVHHTGMAEHNLPYTPDEVPALIRAVQTFHIDGRGWNDIAYNFLIDRFGRVWEGRGRGGTAIIGAHAAYFNTASLGVVYLGEFGNRAPSVASITAGSELIAWLWFIHGIDPDETIAYQDRRKTAPKETLSRLVGHRDVGSTTCPGNGLHALLPRLESTARGLVRTLHGTKQTTTSQVRAPGGTTEHRGDFDGDGRADLLVRADDGWNIWFGSDDGFATRSLPAPRGTSPLPGDFDGDGYDDLLWWNDGGARQTWFGRTDDWFDTGATVLKVPADPDEDDSEPVLRPFADVLGESAGRVPVVGDFDGDGDDDRRGPRTDQLNHQRWHGRTHRHFESEPNILIGAARFVVGDLDGDTIDDIVWFDTATAPLPSYGSHRDEFVPGASVTGSKVASPWLVDVDGREGDELVWTSPNQRSVGVSAERRPRTVGLPAGALGRWSTGDLNGDARPDHVVVSGTRAVLDFGNSGSDPSKGRPSGEPVVGDFDGDGLDDVVWVAESASNHVLWMSS